MAEPSPLGLSPRQRDTLSHLISERNELVSRLEIGSRKIEEMRAAGEDVDQLENFWIGLLHRYEQTCDKVREYEQHVRLRKVS